MGGGKGERPLQRKTTKAIITLVKISVAQAGQGGADEQCLLPCGWRKEGLEQNLSGWMLLQDNSLKCS